MTTLVTGASGFIGRHVVSELIERGDEIIAVARRPPADMPGVDWVGCDLLQPDAMRDLFASRRPTRLLHLAWNAKPGSFWTAPDNADWAQATIRLQQAFFDAGGTRAVYAGSCAEYDWTTDLLGDDTPHLKPATLYGSSKLATWEELERAGRVADLSIAWGRIFFLYGPGEARGRLVSDVISAVLQGEPVACSDGLQQRDFMQVKDVARAFIALLESDVRGTVNIASGDCRPVRDLLCEIGTQTGQLGLIRLGARTAAPEPLRLEATIERLRKEVGFTPHYNLSDGIADTIAWWRRELAPSAETSQERQ